MVTWPRPLEPFEVAYTREADEFLQEVTTVVDNANASLVLLAILGGHQMCTSAEPRSTLD